MSTNNFKGLIPETANNIKYDIQHMSIIEILNYIDKKIKDNILDYEVKISLTQHLDKRDEIIQILNSRGYAVSGNKYDLHNIIIINW